MKLSEAQRARLIVLFTASMAALTAGEVKELAFLQGLAEESGELEGIKAEALQSSEVRPQKSDSEPQAEPAKPAPKAEDAEPAKPSLLDQARGLGASNGKLIAEVRDLKRANGELKADAAALKGERDRLLAENADLKTERDQLSAALTETEAKVTTVDRAAADAIAAIGIPSDRLPAAAATGSSDVPGTKAELEEALKDKSLSHADRSRMVREFKARQRDGARAKAAQN